MSEPGPPETLRDGRYVLGALLGEGGMAEVRRARDTELGVDRAVKLLRVGGTRREAARRRFRAEARAMARLRHPHILTIYDVGSDDALDWIVMELATGGTLAELARRRRVDPEVACHLLIDVLGALQLAHDAGVVHRDVKPHNVLLDHEGRPLLADFGIALLADDERTTRTGVAMGSVAYMPPEQRLDAASVGPAADLYAAGATLYHLVSGDNPVDLFLAPPDSERWARVPAPLRPVLLRAVHVRPEQRWPSAAAFAEALRQTLDDPRLAGSPAPTSAPNAGPTGSQPTGFGHTQPAAPAEPSRPTTLASGRTAPGPPSTQPARPSGRAVAALAAGGGLLLLTLLWPTSTPTSPGAVRPPVTTSAARATSPKSPPSTADAPPHGDAIDADARIDADDPLDPDDPVVALSPPIGPPAAAVHAPVPHAPIGAAPPQASAAPEAAHPTAPPHPSDSPSSAVAGGWRGSLGGIALRVQLHGLDTSLHGRSTSAFGDNRVEGELTGRFDPATGALQLEVPDEPETRYELAMSDDGERLEGQLHTARGMRRLTLRREPR